MSNYLVVQIGAFLLTAGIAGFLAGLWFWSIRSSGLAQRLMRNHSSDVNSIKEDLVDERAAAAEAHAANEAATARNRALEARIRLMEDTSAAASAAKEAEISRLRERIASIEVEASRTAEHAAMAQDWSRRFDA